MRVTDLAPSPGRPPDGKFGWWRRVKDVAPEVLDGPVWDALGTCDERAGGWKYYRTEELARADLSRVLILLARGGRAVTKREQKFRRKAAEVAVILDAFAMTAPQAARLTERRRRALLLAAVGAPASPTKKEGEG